MDDHRWALFIWEQHRQKTGGARYSLMHADYHWDSNSQRSRRCDADLSDRVAKPPVRHMQSTVQQDNLATYAAGIWTERLRTNDSLSADRFAGRIQPVDATH